MKICVPAFLAVLAVAGLVSLPALAGDGEAGKTSGPAGGECKAGDKAKGCGGCGEKAEGKCSDGAKKECAEGAKKACGDEAGADCPDCVAGAKEGKECCQAKIARSDLEVVTLAAVEGTSEAAKKVLAAVPAAAMEKVEAARKTALEQLARIQGAITELKADFDAACAEAKAKGAEIGCEVKATFEADMKTLHAKSKEQIDLCAKAIREAIGEEKVKELSADCRKAGDVAKAAGAKIKAAAAKLLEKAKAGEECGDAPAGEGKCEEKCEEKKPSTKDPQ